MRTEGTMVYVGSCCTSTMASIGWKIDRPLHLHSLSPPTHRRLESLLNNTMCFPSYSGMDSCRRPRFFDAVNIGDGKSAWAYRYTTMRNENKDKNGRQVAFNGVHGSSHCGRCWERTGR
jgi:hypothetical protein